MNILNFSDKSNIIISFTQKYGMVEHFYKFEYTVSLSSQNEVNKKSLLQIFPANDKIHGITEYKDDLSNFFENHRKIFVENEYFENILKKIQGIDLVKFSNITTFYDMASIDFEIEKGNFHMEIKYIDNFNLLKECKTSKKEIDTVIELNNIYKELKNKIEYKTWYNQIAEKYNKEQNEYKLKIINE